MRISVKYGVFTRNTKQRWLRTARGMPAFWCLPSDTVIALVITGHFYFIEPCSLLDPTDWVTTESRYGRGNTTLFICCAHEIVYVWQRTPRGKPQPTTALLFRLFKKIFLLILSYKSDRPWLISVCPLHSQRLGERRVTSANMVCLGVKLVMEERTKGNRAE